MATEQDLKNKGYTQAEINAAKSTIIPAAELGVGQPLRETHIKSTYLLASLAGGGLNFDANLQNNTMQRVRVNMNGSTANGITYTNNGSTFNTANYYVDYNLSTWNTALVMIKSAGGGGGYSNTTSNSYNLGRDVGLITTDILRVTALGAYQPSLGGLTSLSMAQAINKGGSGLEFHYLVDLRTISTVRLTIGVGGRGSVWSGTSITTGTAGGETSFGTYIKLGGGMLGANTPGVASGGIPGEGGDHGAMQIIRID